MKKIEADSDLGRNIQSNAIELYVVLDQHMRQRTTQGYIGSDAMVRAMRVLDRIDGKDRYYNACRDQDRVRNIRGER